MCGIAAISLSPNSKINARLLSNRLLTGIEDRGYMAAGYAYGMRRNDEPTMGYYKRDVPGSTLSLRFLPRKPDTVILHTRLATQGSTNDMSNNHPVLSADRRIALVHNGVIYNDDMIRMVLERGSELAEVDSAVLPELVATSGVSRFKELEGYASLGWIDSLEPEVLHIARFDYSPVAYTFAKDGSFIAASTAPILRKALAGARIKHGEIFEMEESEYFTVKNGIVQEQDMLDKPSIGATSKYTFMTDGAKGSNNSYGYNSYGWPAQWGETEEDVEKYWSGTVTQIEDGEYSSIGSRFMSTTDGEVSPVTHGEFYTLSHGGAYKEWSTWAALTRHLASFTGYPSVEDMRMFKHSNEETCWIETIMDLGWVSPQSRQLTSFIEDGGDMRDLLSETEPVPAWVRGGMEALRAAMR